MSKIVVSRIKGQGETVAEVKAWNDSISVGVELPLEQFLDLLVEEVGNPTRFLTISQLKKAVAAASPRVISRLKLEIKKVF